MTPPPNEISRAVASADATGRSIARTPGTTKRQPATAAGRWRTSGDGTPNAVRNAGAAPAADASAFDCGAASSRASVDSNAPGGNS